MAKKTDTAVKERAIRLVLAHQSEYPSKWAAISAVAKQCGVGGETLRKWVNQAEVNAGDRNGVSLRPSMPRSSGSKPKTNGSVKTSRSCKQQQLSSRGNSTPETVDYGVH